MSQGFPRQTGISEVTAEALAFHQGPKLHKRVSNSSCWLCTCWEAAPRIPHEHTTEIPAPGNPGEANGAHRDTEAFTNARTEFHKCHLNRISFSKEQAQVWHLPERSRSVCRHTAAPWPRCFIQCVPSHARLELHGLLPATLPLGAICRSHCQLNGVILKAAIQSLHSFPNSIFSLQFG